MNLPQADIAHVHEHSPMRDFMGKKVFVYGLGWFGSWIVDCLQMYGLKVMGKGSKQPFPTNHFDYAIHAASGGTKEFLDFVETLDIPKCLYISSGAIYNRTDDYAKNKMADEKLCGEHPANPVIARCYTFVGPRQRLDAQWAVGNFLKDALEGRYITVKGDGKAVRSYMHMADLVVWLLTLLAKGTPGKPYNVGSEEAVSIENLARTIGRITGCGIRIEANPCEANCYVPTTFSAKALGLKVNIPLYESLQRTWRWINL